MLLQKLKSAALTLALLALHRLYLAQTQLVTTIPHEVNGSPYNLKKVNNSLLVLGNGFARKINLQDNTVSLSGNMSS